MTFRTLPTLLKLTLLAALVHLSWLVLRWGDPKLWDWYADLLYLPVMILGALTCLRAAGRPELRSSLGLLGLGMLLHSAGDSTWTYLELFTHAPPFPSMADVLYVMAYPFFFVALLRLQPLSRHRLDTLRVILDSLVSVSVTASVLWWVFLADLVQESHESPVALLASLAYPLLDLSLLSLILVVILAGRGLSGSRLLLLGGFGSLVLADLGFLYREQTGGYVTGDPIDGFFTLAFVLLALGAWQFSQERRTAPHDPAPSALQRGRLGWQLLPYLAVMGLCLVLWFLPQSVGLRHRGVVAGTILSMLLLLARQALAFSQNLQLTRELQQYTRELQQSREQLAHQAHRDALTNLPNRTLFEMRLSEALSLPPNGSADFPPTHASAFAVAFIDLDGFKQVNDTYGHDTGDLLLQAVARRLQSVMRPEDTLARQGGDEFLVLLTLPAGRNPQQASQELLGQFQEPFRLQQHQVRLGASIGVSLYPQDAREAGELRRCADVAMYRAKRAGKNEVRFFNEHLDGQVLPDVPPGKGETSIRDGR